jgi:integrase/recombinase XerC
MFSMGPASLHPAHIAMRLYDALDAFVLQLRADGRSPHTIANYQRHVAALDQWLAAHGRSADLDAITPALLAEYLADDDVRRNVHGGVRSTSTVNAVRTSLRVVFGWLHDAGHTRANPARLIRRAICSPPPPRALSDAQVDALLGALDSARGETARRDGVLIRMLLATGIRLGSALALDVEDLDFATGAVTLRRVKRDRVERIFLGREIRERLEAFVTRRRGPLFRGPQGERLVDRHARRRICDWLDRIGAHDATVHSLRHTFATRLLRATGDLFLVKRALLHRSIASTVVYVSVSDERLRAAMDGVQ